MTVFRPFDRVFTPTALTTLVVPLIDIKAHLVVSSSRDDTLIQSYGLAAQEIVERQTGRLLSVRACTLKLSGLPADGPIELPGGAVTTLTSVVVDGVTLTGCAVYGDSPAMLYPADAWPAVTGTVYPVVISYTAGYAAVPAALQAAVKMIAADLYDRRESATPDQAYASPFAAETLMGLYRIKPL